MWMPAECEAAWWHASNWTRRVSLFGETAAAAAAAGDESYVSGTSAC